MGVRCCKIIQELGSWPGTGVPLGSPPAARAFAVGCSSQSMEAALCIIDMMIFMSL